MSVPLNWQNVYSEHLSTYLIINTPSVIIRASSLPFGITPQSQVFRVPENWGGMGPKSVSLLSLLFFLCYVGLGPGPGPLTSVKHIASHGLKDSSSLTQISPWLARLRHAAQILRQDPSWAGHTSGSHVSIWKGIPRTPVP